MSRVRLAKMKTLLDQEGQVHYELPLLNGNIWHPEQSLGQKITLTFLGEIQCLGCNAITPVSNGQGYCRSCFFKLAECDQCMVRPELCSYHTNGCRQPEWGKQHCLIDHTLYLSNASGLKVGITRSYQRTNRWMDQGAVQAIAVFSLSERLLAGQLEVKLKQRYADKTHWQRMLSGEPEFIDLRTEATQLIESSMAELSQAVPESDLQVITMRYPVLEYPKKARSMQLAKVNCIEGTLLGIKGQYLILDTGVFQLRSHGGYMVDLRVGQIDAM